MRNRIILALILLLLSGVSYAQAEADVLAFNDAFAAYKAAMQQPRTDLQMDAARDVLALGRTLLEPMDERLPVLMNNYGAALFAGARQDESKEILKEALDLAEEIHGKDAMRLVGILSNLADAEGESYSPGRQLKLYKRALKIVANSEGEESDDYAHLALRAGNNVYQYSRSAKGRKYILEAYEFFLANRGETALETGLAAFYLGRLEFAKRNHKKSIEYTLASLEAFEAPENDPGYQLYARAMLVQAYEDRGQTDLATEHCVAIGKLNELRPNKDYQPLFRMAPSYPKQLLAQGIEGYVDFSFTIDENGFVRDPQVVNRASTGRPDSRSINERMVSLEDRSFDAAALKVVERFRYAPRFVDGKAVAVEGIKTRVTFELTD